MLRPNAAAREARIQERRIRTLSEPVTSRAQTPLSADAVVSVGQTDTVTGEFVRFGRVGIDPLSLFRVAN